MKQKTAAEIYLLFFFAKAKYRTYKKMIKV